MKMKIHFVLLSALLLCCILPAAAGADGGYPTRFDSLINKIATDHEINPLFVKALIWRESKFDPCATGNAEEIGLMQIKPSVIKDWARENGCKLPSRVEAYDPQINLQIGIWYLSRALKHWEGYVEQTGLALCEYNSGRKALLRMISHYNGNFQNAIYCGRSAEYVRSITAKFVELTSETNVYEIAVNP